MGVGVICKSDFFIWNGGGTVTVIRFKRLAESYKCIVCETDQKEMYSMCTFAVLFGTHNKTSRCLALTMFTKSIDVAV